MENKLVGASDADFRHDGIKATSGIVVLLNGAAVAFKARHQTTVSNTTAEAEVKALSVCVEMVRSLADFLGEMTHAKHGCVRTMVDSIGAESQIVHGMDSKVCASYKRAQYYCEDAVGSGLLWIDRVPGAHNPSDLLTKAVRNVGEFAYKNGVLNGSAPRVYASPSLLGILAKKC